MSLITPSVDEKRAQYQAKVVVREDNGFMDILKFEKNEDMPVRIWKNNIRRDPLRGRFDSDKDFEGEVFVDYEWKDGDQDKGVRVSVCPYKDPGKCVWRWGPTITGDHWCEAVKQTTFIHDRGVDHSRDSRCKVNVARKDRR